MGVAESNRLWTWSPFYIQELRVPLICPVFQGTHPCKPNRINDFASPFFFQTKEIFYSILLSFFSRKLCVLYFYTLSLSQSFSFQWLKLLDSCDCLCMRSPRLKDELKRNEQCWKKLRKLNYHLKTITTSDDNSYVLFCCWTIAFPKFWPRRPT